MHSDCSTFHAALTDSTKSLAGSAHDAILSPRAIDELRDAMPEPALRLMLEQKHFTRLDDYSSLLHYRLISEADNSFTDYADIHQDLSDKIINHLGSFADISSFCDLLKSKDLTYTRLQRSMLHILLGIRSDDMTRLKAAGYPVYARLLGFRRSASHLLAIMNGKEKNIPPARIPVISRLSDSDRLLDPAALAMLSKDIQASQIYHLFDTLHISEYSKRVIII
jgi:predicted nucleotidyltransferase